MQGFIKASLPLKLLISDLSFNQITSKGVDKLLEGPFSCLERINLGENQLAIQDLFKVSKSVSWSKLKEVVGSANQNGESLKFDTSQVGANRSLVLLPTYE